MTRLYKLMTATLCLALGVGLVGCKGKQVEQVNDLQQEGLLGKVKQVECYYYTEGLPADTLEGNHSVYSRIAYNQAGYQTERYIEDCLVEQYHYKYDQEGKKLLESTSEVLGDEKDVGTTSYTYGKNGLVSEENYRERGELGYRLRFEYDRDNRLTATKYYDPQDSLYHIIVNQYNDRGLLSLSYLQNPEGERWNPVSYRYNAQGLLVEEIHCSTDSVEEYRKLYEYDDKGRKISEKHRAREDYNSFTRSYRYDQYGNVLEEIHTQGEDTTQHRYEYEYDSHGNWTKSLEYSFSSEGGETLVTVIRRRIQYYPS